MKNFELAKKICKEHGVKGFRKLKLKRPMYISGKQCQSINAHIAKRLIDRLLSEGFEIRDANTCYQLAEKGLLDTITVC
jgi:hypothetical protein